MEHTGLVSTLGAILSFPAAYPFLHSYFHTPCSFCPPRCQLKDDLGGGAFLFLEVVPSSLCNVTVLLYS